MNNEVWYASDTSWIDSNMNWFKKTVNRFIVNLFRKTVNRFTAILFMKTVNRFTAILFKKIWLNSKGVTQGKWTNGMLDMNQWIMNRIKQFTEGFSIMTTHKTSKNHMTTHKTSKNHMTLWDMVC